MLATGVKELDSAITKALQNKQILGSVYTEHALLAYLANTSVTIIIISDLFDTENSIELMDKISAVNSKINIFYIPEDEKKTDK